MLALVLPLAGCGTMTAGGATKAALCEQFAPIKWSDSDTDESLKQIKAHNAVGRAICGW
jgi:hypothetical protein